MVDLLLLILPGVIWGASFLFIAEGLEAIGPNGVTFVRIFVGFLTLSLIPAARRPIVRSDRAATVVLGVLWLAFPLSMFPLAEQHVSSALTGMLNGATPICAAAVASIMARRLPSRTVLTGLAVGLLGAVIIALPDFSNGGGSGNQAWGILLIVAAIISYGIAINLARPLQQRNAALSVTWHALAVAALLTAPLGLPSLLDAHWTPRALASLLTLGAFGTAIAQVLTATAAGRMGATAASTTSFLIPVVALALGVGIRREHVAWLSIVGAGICLSGAWIVRQARMAEERAAAVQANAASQSVRRQAIS